MTTPGYIDYARVNLAAGFLLAGDTKKINVATNVFTGYVGAWSFVNAFWNAGGGSDNYTIQMEYFSDSTFSSQIGVQVGVRNSNCVAWRQYGVLSPWVIIGIIPKLGTDTVTITYAFFGSNSSSTSAKLASLDTDLLSFNGSIAATSNVSLGFTHVVPGAAVLSFHSNVNTTWTMELQRWDFGTSAWIDDLYIDQNTSAFGGVITVALPDAQIQIVIGNGNAAAKNFRCYVVPVLS
jgi:hypothetical protein